MTTPPLPAGTNIEPDPATRSIEGGTVLMGGVPLSVMRLSPTGAGLVRGWFEGRPVSGSKAHGRLARRLVANGLAHPRPSTGGDRTDPLGNGIGDLTLVIPVKDDPSGLGATLAALGPAHVSRTIVVDDGSTIPVRATGDAAVIRREHVGGPARARQDALADVSTDLVAFIDAGVTVDRTDLQRLLAHFADPAVVAVAPRIASRPDDHAVARYERSRSPLDLGPSESLVGIGRAVPYVPTACLVARTQTVVQVGGFDTELRYGEDVDLVWRLSAAGTVRYDPSVVVLHPSRPGLRAMIGQRMAYGSAAAPLARRHGLAVAPARTSPWTAGIVGLALLGRPVGATVVAAGTAEALRRKLDFLPDARVESAVLTAKGHWFGGWSLLIAAVRAWLPLLVALGAARPAWRRRLATAVLMAWGRRVLDGPGGLGPRVLDAGFGAIDDSAYCVGVWKGALRERSLRALLPDLVTWPPRDEPGTAAVTESLSTRR